MKKIHLRLEYGTPTTLCGDQSDIYTYLIITYFKYPNLDGYNFYPNSVPCEWCPDCITHPDVIIAKLNGTNV